MNLFVYGTLLFPEIRRFVGGRDFSSEEASLADYRLYRVKGADFPGIVSCPGGIVEGEILFDLTTEEIDRFDRYEDDFYVRSGVTTWARSAPGTEVSVQIYEVPVEVAPDILSGETWTREWFARRHRDDFLDRLRRNG